MGAYNALYGVPVARIRSCYRMLRKQWGFDGLRCVGRRRHCETSGASVSTGNFNPGGKPPPRPSRPAAISARETNSQPDRATLRRSTNWSADTRGWLHGGTDYFVLTNAVAQGLISERRN